MTKLNKTIGATVAEAKESIEDASTGETITIDGTVYKVADTDSQTDSSKLSLNSIKAKIVDGSTVEYKGTKVTAMTDKT